MNRSTIIRTQKKHFKWQALSTGCLAHFIHDGFTDMIYVFFPIWQAQWALTFVEVDFAGIGTTVIIVAVVLLATIPLTLPLRGKLVG